MLDNFLAKILLHISKFLLHTRYFLLHIFCVEQRTILGPDAEVWPWSEARSTWHPPLVGCTRPCHIQVMLVCLQVSAWNGTAVSVGDVPPADLVCGWPSSFASSCPSSSCRTSLQTNDCWQKGIFFCWPVSMEQSSRVPQKRNAYFGSLDSFKRYPKCFLFDSYWQRIEHTRFLEMIVHYINVHLLLLLRRITIFFIFIIIIF